jgi:hypothetical protein
LLEIKVSGKAHFMKLEIPKARSREFSIAVNRDFWKAGLLEITVSGKAYFMKLEIGKYRNPEVWK